MTESPKYPVPTVDLSAEQARPADTETPPGLYSVPSFKHRHELRDYRADATLPYYDRHPEHRPRKGPSTWQSRRRARLGV